MEQLLQYYLWRWDIEVNHRDEKQLIGVGEAQVRSPRSVERQPALAVASYAALLLAAARVYGIDGPPQRPAWPKWQTKSPEQRISTRELVRQLKSEVLAYGLERLNPNSEHFVARATPPTKCPEFRLPMESALLYASTG